MKSRLILFLLLCLCPLATGLCPLANAATPQERNKAIARRVFDELLNQGHFELASELYAPDFVNHGRTRDASLKEDQDAARGWKSAFPDFHITIVQIIAEDDLVTVLWTAKGTNTGTGVGLPATGKSASGRGITIWRIRDGKIVEEWSELDRHSMLQQLGLAQ